MKIPKKMENKTMPILLTISTNYNPLSTAKGR